MQLVVDASAIFEIVARTPFAAAAEDAADGHDLVAPDLLDVEVLSALRREEHRRAMSSAHAREAVGLLSQAPIRRLSAAPLVEDIWRHRRNLTAYAAVYVALAERLDCPLLTADRAMAIVRHIGVDVRLV